MTVEFDEILQALQSREEGWKSRVGRDTEVIAELALYVGRLLGRGHPIWQAANDLEERQGDHRALCGPGTFHDDYEQDLTNLVNLCIAQSRSTRWHGFGRVTIPSWRTR